MYTDWKRYPAYGFDVICRVRIPNHVKCEDLEACELKVECMFPIDTMTKTYHVRPIRFNAGHPENDFFQLNVKTEETTIFIEISKDEIFTISKR